MPAWDCGRSQATGGGPVKSDGDGLWDEAQKLGREEEATWTDDVGAEEGKR